MKRLMSVLTSVALAGAIAGCGSSSSNNDSGVTDAGKTDAKAKVDSSVTGAETGEPCTADEDCSGQTCLTEIVVPVDGGTISAWKGGYCTGTCDPLNNTKDGTDDCSGAAMCTDGWALIGGLEDFMDLPACAYANCGKTADCRSGYNCQIGAGGDWWFGMCMPDVLTEPPCTPGTATGCTTAPYNWCFTMTIDDAAGVCIAGCDFVWKDGTPTPTATCATAGQGCRLAQMTQMFGGNTPNTANYHGACQTALSTGGGDGVACTSSATCAATHECLKVDAKCHAFCNDDHPCTGTYPTCQADVDAAGNPLDSVKNTGYCVQ